MQRTTKRETGSGAEKAGSDRDQKNLERRRRKEERAKGSSFIHFKLKIDADMLDDDDLIFLLAYYRLLILQVHINTIRTPSFFI